MCHAPEQGRAEGVSFLVLSPVPLLRLSTLATLAVLAVAPAPAGAQGRSAPAKENEDRSQRPITSDSSVSIPRNMMPPAGKCRIWMRGVPAAQQPAPTDCTTALRQSPANGVLVFGPALRDLSPFDVRNPWSATSSEVTRDRASGRRDSSTRSRPTQAEGNAIAPDAKQPRTRTAPTVREATPTTRSQPTVREATPATRTPPVVREAPPRIDPPPPQTKKPE
jgi:hypothetical protein